MKLGSQLFVSPLAQSLFNELTGLATFIAREAFGFNTRLTVRCDDDFYRFVQATPPTFTVSLIEPSSSDCSMTVCPFLRPSILAFSTTYDCRKRSR